MRKPGDSHPERSHALDAVCRVALDQTAIVAITDGSGRITFVNNKFCEISGYTRDELLGQDHRILNSGTHPRAYFAEMYRTIHGGKVWRGEICNRAKGGNLYWVDTTIVPIPGPDGRPECFVAIRYDITARMLAIADREQAADTIREACETKAEFLANVSHEIRTPLTAILGFAGLLAGEGLDDSDRRRHAETIRRNGEHLLAIVDDLLDMSKLDAGGIKVERVPVALTDLLAEVVCPMRLRAQSKGITLEVAFAGESPRLIRTDPVRLRQILFNLLGNAIKFTDIGSVRVEVALDDPRPGCGVLSIRIVDTGIGIEPGQIARMFAPFSQADQTTTRRFGGTGLGLHISQCLAGLLGGEISVRSEPGVGSVFTLRLPLEAAPGEESLDAAEASHRLARAQAESSCAAQVAPVSLEGARVLLAEDGPDNQRLITFLLRKAGAEVCLAETGHAALARLAEGPRFDAVLMDVQMPELDGLEAARRARARGHTIPIIALTAHALAEDREKALAAGCDDHLTKPVDADRLVRTLRRWIDRREAA